MTNERSIESIVQHAREEAERATNDDGWTMLRADDVSRLIMEIDRLRGQDEPSGHRHYFADQQYCMKCGKHESAPEADDCIVSNDDYGTMERRFLQVAEGRYRKVELACEHAWEARQDRDGLFVFCSKCTLCLPVNPPAEPSVRLETDAELAKGLKVTNAAYPPGDKRRYEPFAPSCPHCGPDGPLGNL